VANATGQANVLYRNEGGGFTETGEAAGANNSYGVSWGDYDGDGDLDLHVANRNTHPSVLYRNDAGTFTPTGEAPGVGDDWGTAWADYDGDGDLDLYVNTSGLANVLYRNDSASFNWLAVDLVSSVSAPDGNGARVTAVADGQRQVRYPDGGSSRGSQNATPVHFGFGATSTIDSLIVDWPSGLVSELTNVTANTVQLLRRRAGHQRRSAADAFSGL